MTKICVSSKVYDVQETREHGIVVSRLGRIVLRGTRAYDMAAAEFHRVAEDDSYAAREAAGRA